jgi:hypothetical protein
MSEALIKLLREGIAAKEAELQELRQNLREQEAASGKKPRRRSRKESGPTEGSIPYMIKECLKEAGKPLGAADISDRLKKKGKEVESRFVSAAISRYVKNERVFLQTPDGLYTLRKE